MEDFASLIKTRRSVRQFTEEPLLPDEVEAILKAGLMAPSSKNCTPWQFVAVEDKAMLTKLSQTREAGSGFLAGCSLAIVVIADVIKTDTWIEDASIAAVFMQLQAADLGLGSCWCQIRNRAVPGDSETASQYIRDLLEIPNDYEVLCIIGLGHKTRELKPFSDERLQWDKVHIGTYRHDQTEQA